MKMSEFKYNLPEEKIAKHPLKERGSTRLLVLDRKTGSMDSRVYSDCIGYMEEGDVVVLNETKVEKRRAYFKDSKKRMYEVLFLNSEGGNNWLCLVKKSKYLKGGDSIRNVEDENIIVKIVEKRKDGVVIDIGETFSAAEIFERVGHTPIPPYMKREDNFEDYLRYNTVFSKKEGSVAAPTASLNLTEEMLEKMEKKGVTVVKVELEVGWGTFAPVREENIEDHKIHSEKISLSRESAERINMSKKNGGKVWAFGTTVARLLESCSDNEGFVNSYEGETNLYIYPGYQWKVVDHLITNFHMPDSSLILLVSSFGGEEFIKKAYEFALKNKYMFLSYGDSMLII